MRLRPHQFMAGLGGPAARCLDALRAQQGGSPLDKIRSAPRRSVISKPMSGGGDWPLHPQGQYSEIGHDSEIKLPTSRRIGPLCS